MYIIVTSENLLFSAYQSNGMALISTAISKKGNRGRPMMFCA